MPFYEKVSWEKKPDNRFPLPLCFLKIILESACKAILHSINSQPYPAFYI